MKKPVSFTTNNGNSFLYSPFRNQLLLSHPIIRHLFDLDGSGTNLKNYIESYRSGQPFYTPEKYQFTFEELEYQWKKYRFLKKNHFFKSPRPINLNGHLSASRVEKDLKKIQQVIFETTEECNLSCTYCTYSKFYINKERDNKKFDISGAKRALEHILAIRDKNSRQLMISFYGGEPLKNFNFIKEITEFLKSGYGEQYSFKFNISSNGLLLSKHAGFLVENDFEISVSLDGDEAANSFRLISGNKPSHGLVIKNLDYIKDQYPEFFERRVSFLTVLHNRNSFSGVHEYFKKRYGKVPL
ncbi:MAG: radical SAM protein, partial [Mariniphaga sp.]